MGTITRINTRIFGFTFACLILLIVTDSLTANASTLSADDFVITVKTDNPGASTSTQFTIPTNPGVGKFASGKALFASSLSECGALYLDNNAATNITGGGIHSNSDCVHGLPISSPPSLYIRGVGTVYIEYDVSAAGGITFADGYLTLGGGVDALVPQVEIEQIPEPDCSNLPAQNDSGTVLQPGIYPTGFNISSRDVILQPGLYCLDGDLRVLSGGTLTGDNVTLFLRGSSGFILNGGNSYLTAPQNDLWVDGSGNYWNGMLIYQAHGNTGGLVINGNDDSYFQGTIFSKSSSCTWQGNIENSTQSIQLVCDTISLNGDRAINIHYNPDYHYSTIPEESYNYNVDCNNDGILEATGLTGDYTCNYPSPGTYTIRISDNVGDGTGFPSIYFRGGGDKDKLLSIDQWGTGKWTTMEKAFYGASKLAYTAADQPDLSKVSNMNWMFSRASKFNGDIGNWNTANVNMMFRMFSGASSFNQDIGNWDTSNVIDMSGMFYGASAFDQNIGKWDVSSLKFAWQMFGNTQLSTPNYDTLLIGWASQNLLPGVNFNGGNSTYCVGEAARASMISSDGWSITDGGKAEVVPPMISFLAPVAGGSLMQPRALLAVEASDPSGISKVEFWGRDQGTWTLLGMDTDGSDGWQYQWATNDIDAPVVDVKAVAYDRCSNQTPAQLNGITLTQTHTFGNGYETRGGGEGGTEDLIEAFQLKASVKTPGEKLLGSRHCRWILMR